MLLGLGKGYQNLGTENDAEKRNLFGIHYARDAFDTELALRRVLVMHVVAFFDTIESRGNNQTEIQKNQRHTYKTLWG